MTTWEQHRGDHALSVRLAGVVIVVTGILLTLGCSRHPAVEARRFKIAEVDALGDVSADGHLLTYVDWSTGDLALRDLVTGADRHMTNKGTWEESSSWAEYSLISHDAARVAYSWRREDGVYDLRLLEIEHPVPSVLVAGDGFEYLAPRDWSRDGRNILAWQTRASGERDILLISVPEGDTRILKTLAGSVPGKMQLSPDGKFVAHDALADTGTQNHDVHLLAVSDGQGTPLVNTNDDERVFGWSPDGEWILFSRETASHRSLWRIRVANGQPVAAAEIVLGGVEQEIVESLGFTETGNWYYGVMEWTDDLYLASLDTSSGTLKTPRRIVTRMAVNSSADWSPDGRFLAWIEGGGEAHHTRTLVVRDGESGEEARWAVDVNDRHGHRPRWTANGESIVMEARDTVGRPILLAIAARTGSTRRLAKVESTCVDDCVAWSVRRSSDAEGLWTTDGRSIGWRGVSAGSPEERYRAPESWSISRLILSPDGLWLAFVAADSGTESTRLALLPVSGGSLRELLELKGIEVHYSTGGTRVTWSRDSSFLLLARSAGRVEVPIEIWHVPVDRSSPTRLSHALPEPSLFGMSLHPNGQTVALSLGKPGRYEIWKLAGALPQ
jgi:Tol biopolymer transport system component